jgi:hypothetical protein
MIASIFFIRVKNLYYSLKNVRQNKPKTEVETAIPAQARHQLDFRDLSHSKNCDHEYALSN